MEVVAIWSLHNGGRRFERSLHNRTATSHGSIAQNLRIPHHFKSSWDSNNENLPVARFRYIFNGAQQVRCLTVHVSPRICLLLQIDNAGSVGGSNRSKIVLSSGKHLVSIT